MADVVRQTLIESKIEVLENLRTHIDAEIETWRRMLEKENSEQHD